MYGCSERSGNVRKWLSFAGNCQNDSRGWRAANPRRNLTVPPMTPSVTRTLARAVIREVPAVKLSAPPPPPPEPTEPPAPNPPGEPQPPEGGAASVDATASTEAP